MRTFRYNPLLFHLQIVFPSGVTNLWTAQASNISCRVFSPLENDVLSIVLLMKLIFPCSMTFLMIGNISWLFRLKACVLWFYGLFSAWQLQKLNIKESALSVHTPVGKSKILPFHWGCLPFTLPGSTRSRHYLQRNCVLRSVQILPAISR